MIKRWDIVYIGHPSRNPYWGEPAGTRARTPVCTCTLITGDGFRLLVDPPIADPDRMAAELHRRSGLTPEEIDLVFVTHAHGDHTAGLHVFSKALWLAGPQVAAALNARGHLDGKVGDASKGLPPDVELVPSPGHAAGHCSLRFDCDGLSVVIAGDATVTREFCLDGLSSFGEPEEEEMRTVHMLRGMADALVPGHDNWFLCRRLG